jgi:hypothetical protein
MNVLLTPNRILDTAFGRVKKDNFRDKYDNVEEREPPNNEGGSNPLSEEIVERG